MALPYLQQPRRQPPPPPPTTLPMHVAEMQRLQSALAAQTGAYYPGATFDMPVAQQTTLLSSARPREFYCWLHGWNNTHNGDTCKIMAKQILYRSYEKCYRTGQHRRQPQSRCTSTFTPSSSSSSSFFFPVPLFLVCLVCSHQNFPPNRPHSSPPARLHQEIRP
jgi:hypothetical protein